MTIENNLLAITNCLFKDKEKYKFVTRKQKEEFFFIINRLLAKRYFREAQLLNNIYTDKAAALDTWFAFMSNKPYPSWIWSKVEKKNKEENFELLQKEFSIHTEDIQLLKLINLKELQEEQKFLIKQKQ